MNILQILGEGYLDGLNEYAEKTGIDNIHMATTSTFCDFYT